MDEKSEEYIKGYEQGANDLAERVKKYYSNLKGKTPCALVEFHIDEIKKEILGEICED